MNMCCSTTDNNQQRTKTLWVTNLFDFPATRLGLQSFFRNIT